MWRPSSSASISELLEVEPRTRKVRPRRRSADWLQQALQAAINLEFATIPPYLCALWSIRELTPPGPAAQAIARIALDEMKHFGQACNLMTAYGWMNRRPAIPTYPGPLPGGVHPGSRVELTALSKDLVGTVFMQIEFASPEAVTEFRARFYPTIGAFYGAIAEVIANEAIPIVGTRQLAGTTGARLIKVTTKREALQAVELIHAEGEGAQGSPWISEDVLGHYYRFAELFWERSILPCGDGNDGWGFCGSRIPFPDVFHMAPVPRRGYSFLPEAREFKFGGRKTAPNSSSRRLCRC